MLSNVITYADVLRPRGRKFASYYDLTLIVGGSVVIALSARMAVMLPFSPVPVTGQTFAVLMAGGAAGQSAGQPGCYHIHSPGCGGITGVCTWQSRAGGAFGAHGRIPDWFYRSCLYNRNPCPEGLGPARWYDYSGDGFGKLRNIYAWTCLAGHIDKCRQCTEDGIFSVHCR